jgi:hypothetical protein
MENQPIDPRMVVDEAYAGSLLAQWALAIAYVGLGIALLLLDVKETHEVRFTSGGEAVNVSWPAAGFWLRATGAALVTGSLTVPFFQWYLGRLERPALQKTLQKDPTQLTGVLSYVANVGLLSTSQGIVAGVFSVALLLADQLSRPDSALRDFRFSVAVWLGAAVMLFGAFSMLAFVLWRRQQYRRILAGEGWLRVTPLKGASGVRRLLLGGAILFAVLFFFSFLPALAGWVRE